MQLGMVGLGRMGGNMAERIRRAGHEVIGYDINVDSGRDVDCLESMVAKLKAPRIVWVMVPSGKPTDDTLSELSALLEPGDLIVNGGNCHYIDDRKNAESLKAKQIQYMDCGVSGGVWGSERGYALMVGGDADAYQRALPIFEALKPEGENGLVHAGPVGGGHFAKMVHNGIEYGMMQAFGEGFATMERSEYIENTAEVMASWRSGSVVDSWLLDLLVRAMNNDPDLKQVPPVADETGEAKWTIEAAAELGVPTPAISAGLYTRLASRGGSDDVLRVVTAMRNQFGGHVTKA